VHGCSCVAFTLARCRRDLQRSGNKHSSAPSGGRLPAGRLLSRRGHHRGLSGGELLKRHVEGSAGAQLRRCSRERTVWTTIQADPPCNIILVWHFINPDEDGCGKVSEFARFTK
jgi:hypothetical protein